MKKFLKFAVLVAAIGGMIGMQSCDKKDEGTPPNKPTSAKVKDVTSTSATLYWEGAAPAYEIEINNERVDVPEAETSITLDNLTELTSYVWKVRAVDGSKVSDWADGEDFKTNAKSVDLGVPTGLKFADVTYKSATLSWKGGENALSFDVEINGVMDATPDKTYLATNLDSDTKITWRVRAVRRGVYSEWVTGPEFTTEVAPVKPDAPTALSFSDVTAIDAKLTWTPGANTTSYQVQIDNMPPALTYYDVTEPNFDLKRLVFDETYTWKVRAFNDGLYSEWVTGPEFKTEDVEDGFFVYFGDESAWEPLPGTISVQRWGATTYMLRVEAYKTWLVGTGDEARYAPGIYTIGYVAKDFTVFNDPEEWGTKIASLQYFTDDYWQYPMIHGTVEDPIYLGDYNEIEETTGYMRIKSMEDMKTSLVSTALLKDDRPLMYGTTQRPAKYVTVILKNVPWSVYPPVAAE